MSPAGGLWAFAAMDITVEDSQEVVHLFLNTCI